MRPLDGDSLGLFAPHLVQVVEIAIRNWGLVLAAEDTHFKVLDLVLRGRFRARGFQVLQILIDDVVCLDGPRNIMPCLLMRDELLWAGQVDTVLVRVSFCVLFIQFRKRLQCGDA